MRRVRLATLSLLLGITAVTIARAAQSLPAPGVGVFFTAAEIASVRQRMRQVPCKAVYDEMVRQTDAAMGRWPEIKAKHRLDALAPQLIDLVAEFTPKEYVPAGGAEASRALVEHVERHAGTAAFIYLVTGERRYADFAWEVF